MNLEHKSVFLLFQCALDRRVKMHIDLTKATIQICSLHSLPFVSVSQCFCFSCADAGSRSYNPNSQLDPLPFDSNGTDMVTKPSVNFAENRPLIREKFIRADQACSTTFAALLSSTLYARTSPRSPQTAYFWHQIFYYFILHYYILSLEQYLVFICQKTNTISL